jgi:hypothetical protein
MFNKKVIRNLRYQLLAEETNAVIMLQENR